VARAQLALGLVGLLLAAACQRIDAPPPPVHLSPAVQAWQTDYLAGRHAGIGSEALRIEGVDLAMDGPRPSLILRMRNTSAHHLSSASVAVRLHDGGSRRPLAPRRAVTDRDAAATVELPFGAAGIAPGEGLRLAVGIGVAELDSWLSPTALATTRHQVLVRLIEARAPDGRAVGRDAPAFSHLTALAAAE
jgi:hypothetical protein